MSEKTWNQEIKRLYELKQDGRLDENDMDEVAEKFNTTRNDVITDLMSVDETSETDVCDTCGKLKPYEEIAMGDGTCQDCINENNNK